jgi:hypothetical protein
MALTTAQAFGSRTGLLHEHGGNGGPVPLSTQPFFISVNSSVHFSVAAVRAARRANGGGRRAVYARDLQSL